MANGLPVLALDRDDWHQHVAAQSGVAKASQRVSAVLEATHPSGWRFGVLARSQARVSASGGALALSQAIAGDAMPASNTRYGLDASYFGWRGTGVSVGIPWQALGVGDWHWTADGQFFQLTDFRYTQFSGEATFDVATQTYGFDVHADRAGTRISGPFLASSAVKGAGYSVSVAAKGELTHHVELELRAQDLLSDLRWGRLAREQLTLNSQVERRRPDGFLDYAPAITGRQNIQAISGRIGARYVASLDWHYAPTYALTARWERSAGMAEGWVFWQGHWPTQSLTLQFGVEAARHAAAAKLLWRGFHVDLGTDGKGLASEYRWVRLGWNHQFK